MKPLDDVPTDRAISTNYKDRRFVNDVLPFRRSSQSGDRLAIVSLFSIALQPLGQKTMMAISGAIRAARLANADCFCVNLDRNELARLLDRDSGMAGFGTDLATSHPYLFSNSPIFTANRTMMAAHSVVQAVEAAAALPFYRAEVLDRASEVAQHDFGPLGALMGYDFHLAEDGPVLIEVNTNAGGAFLNAILLGAQRECCFKHSIAAGPGLRKACATEPAFEQAIVAMFNKEWQLQGREGRLKTIAIIDDEPQDQYLRPEFELAKALLERQGVTTLIADPRKLRRSGKGLMLEGHQVDLVYNRLVDFALDEAAHCVLKDAYLDGAVVVTPNPHIHALYADKRNFALLSDDELLDRWGLDEDHAAVLRSSIPRTWIVNPDNADELWADRRNLFFKPARGYASKAAYRGSKLTRKVWAQIMAGEYIAQRFAPPSTRRVIRDGETIEMKVDVRLYTYDGSTLMTAARLYQGQTTNMRTPGGGFAPILEVAV